MKRRFAGGCVGYVYPAAYSRALGGCAGWLQAW
jgi:hypothetical protein